MAQPTTTDVHVDAALSQISIAYKNAGYISRDIFPQVQVAKQSDKYFVWTKDSWFRNHVQIRAPGAVFPEGGLELSSVQYVANVYDLAFPLPDEVLANQDPAIDLATAGAEWLADQFLLNEEIQWAADHFVTGVWGTSNTPGNNWDDFESGDPITDVLTAKQTIKTNTGVFPNTMVVGQKVWDEGLKEHPLLLDKYKYTQKGVLTEDLVASALGIDRLLVGSASQNTAKEGATFSASNIFGSNALYLYVPPSAGLMTPAAGYTFVWPIDNGGLDVQVSRIREDNRKRDLLMALHAWDQKITGSDLGYIDLSIVS